LQGFTVIVLPFASRLPVGNVEALIAKMHDPNVVVPVAVFPPEAIENAGVVDVLVHITVVVLVVAKSEMPAGNVNGILVTAAVVAAFAGSVVSPATTWTGAGSPPPPPHAVRAAAVKTASARLSIFFMVSPFPRPTAELSRLQQGVSSVKKSERISRCAR
jgi:hypothetical protein